jgi:hypothetical protein
LIDPHAIAEHLNEALGPIDAAAREVRKAATFAEQWRSQATDELLRLARRIEDAQSAVAAIRNELDSTDRSTFKL